MKIQKIINKTKDKPLYEKGSHTMWTDDYIAEQLLAMHLEPNIDVASRSKINVEKTIDWICNKIGNQQIEILDLGCGPGLYTEKLAKVGHKVTGFDFSKNSINYAQKSAKLKALEIDYKCQNYLDMTNENQYDMILMIYCDFGVLSLKEREILIKNVYRALKPGGKFYFDALNENSIEKMKFEKTWEMAQSGFWSPNPYIALSKSSHFKEEKAILDEHIILDENDEWREYRFINHYFELQDIKDIFEKTNFKNIKKHENIIENDSAYNDVTFYEVEK